MLIACVDGLTGFPEAIAAAFPKTQVQICIVHRVRNSRCFVSWKDRKEIAAGLKNIYQSITVTEAEQALEAFTKNGMAYIPRSTAHGAVIGPI